MRAKLSMPISYLRKRALPPSSSPQHHIALPVSSAAWSRQQFRQASIEPDQCKNGFSGVRVKAATSKFPARATSGSRSRWNMAREMAAGTALVPRPPSAHSARQSFPRSRSMTKPAKRSSGPRPLGSREVANQKKPTPKQMRPRRSSASTTPLSDSTPSSTLWVSALLLRRYRCCRLLGVSSPPPAAAEEEDEEDPEKPEDAATTCSRRRYACQHCLRL
mmetsp:Transcript_156147/g.500876  ORF Transcript_156147/g.500876 Transcript_156147/m.500876 type:complete len:219 (-) Transcript_156147:1411-2067(-)